METDSDTSDEEVQLRELSRLQAVLDADERGKSQRLSQSTSHGIDPESFKKQQEEYLNKIQKATEYNNLTDQKLAQLQRVLLVRLRECRQRLASMSRSSTATDNEEKSFRYVSCGKPYFKDKDGFPAPPNKDTIAMSKMKMFDLTLVSSVPGWTIKDKSEFLKQIHKMSVDIRKSEIESQIAQLLRDKKSNVRKRELTSQIAVLRKQIEELKKKPLSELALPIDKEYDWETLANKTNYRHNAHEYRALWKLFLHPSINKNIWSKTEHMQLQKLAHTYKMQDWDRIASELNTGRTGYQCFVYYRTNMSTTTMGQKWTKEEEEYLKRLIDYYKEDSYIPWSKVAASMEKRTKIQIYNKYARLMEHRKGRFVPEEDAVILTCVRKFGTNFRRISKYLPGRSMAQLRARYQVLTGAKTTSIVWTVEEDRKLIQFMANQDTSINYSSLTKHFKGKGRAHIRARYTTLVKWMRKHPHVDISKAPRRGARRLGHGEASQDINLAIENLKKRIQSDVQKKNSTRQEQQNKSSTSPEEQNKNSASPEEQNKSSTSAEEQDKNPTNPEEQNKSSTSPEEQNKNSTSSEEQDKNATKVSSKITMDSTEEEIEEAIIVTLYNQMLEKQAAKQSVESVTAKEKQMGSQIPPDATNLKKILLLLKAQLDKEKFLESSYYKDYPTLTKLEKDSPLLLKSYSKKKAVEMVEVEGKPDIWGNKVLETSEYVFPPNYATITGCRQLMAYVAAHPPPENLNVILSGMARRNPAFKEQMDTLVGRFIALFLWPMLLSNESPSETTVKPVSHLQNKPNLILPGDPGIAIPKAMVDIVNENIDLEDDSDDKEEIDIGDVHVGNDDFMYIK